MALVPMGDVGVVGERALRSELHMAGIQEVWPDIYSKLRQALVPRVVMRHGAVQLGPIVAGAFLGLGRQEGVTGRCSGLGLFEQLGRSFKTTNCIENPNSMVAQRTDSVDYWKNADQKHRWLATALPDIDLRLQATGALAQRLQTHLKGCLEQVARTHGAVRDFN